MQEVILRCIKILYECSIEELETLENDREMHI